MRRFDLVICDVLFILSVVILLGGAWLFGAWEAWYFWPFVGLIFLASGGLGLRMIFSARLGVARLAVTPWLGQIVLSWLPFLAYAVIRAVQAPVRMDAERSLLLHITPFLTGLVIVVGLNPEHRRKLWAILPLNFLLLGLYGIGNHFLANNSKVLWMPGFPHYQQDHYRATGSYYCPDHFAGIMELALCIAIAVIAAKGAGTWRRVGMTVLAAVSVLGISLSKSRGGGFVLVLILGLALWWGVMAWSPRQRLMIRLAGLVVGLVALVGVVVAGTSYVQRFKQYPWTKLEHSDRYQMSAAALRGWMSSPWIGIGPGMHQNLWPHFAPSADGDREKGIRPRFLNNSFHSYEAHNDWVQLLEEYGLVGVILFLWAVGRSGMALLRGWKRAAADLSRGVETSVLPAALLAAAAMVLHSGGDFNLQIPATTWLLAAMMALALAFINDNESYQDVSRRYRSRD